MPVKSFYDICSRPQTKKKTVKELCLDFSEKDKPKYFIQSDIEMIDFDALAKEVGSIICSPDALTLKDNIVHFIEFKNQEFKKVDIKRCQKKFYEGLSIFGILSKNENTINNVKIQYTIICNPNKSGISTKTSREKNPFSNTIQSNAQKVGESLISDKEMSDYQKTKEGKFQYMKKLLSGLSKFGINVEVDILLIQEEIDEFLSQFEDGL